MPDPEIGREQEYVSVLYGRLDDLRERASGHLAGVLRQSGGTHQARTEREAFLDLYVRQLAQFDAAEQGLCFGRLDSTTGPCGTSAASACTPRAMITPSC